MPSYPFLLLDAFTETALGGNPCAVVLDADDLTDEQMQRLGQEFNQSETAFVRRSEVAEFGVRYFTPSEEIPLAGHPTIATITALLHTGRLLRPTTEPLALQLELIHGPIAIAVLPPATPTAPAQVLMTQRRPVFGQIHDAAQVLPLFGLTPDDLVPGSVVQTVSTGTPQLMVLVRDAATLRRAYLPNPAALEEYRRRTDFFSSHLFCLEGATSAGATFARHLCTPPDVLEDPVTGSATGGMAAYLWHYGYLSRPDFVAEQGHWLGRPGTVQVSVHGPREAIEAVQIGGTGVVVLEGLLRL
ncbi:trans-2,3-dihydro-3-hydroxyanthranilate isomerase [Hymenobacter luteus]|uniref:Trans-2,3-dihydro-3-hydroxyanthranilate isomerase n=2 Tax=Hymenobacter TaxID=89966 RepID=A0A7W9T3X3_9BACT|nr:MULTISPECIES: PhzF family phenazine biosynthesis protein [Hymenobacter]MBB4601583.1 trans-2,3-dihydro-3-hydroxyanthranilate isomerase [Hymenobacter latericoloratus]MBB6059989.1 trans-2,3-dihydro-3-hydroxyanthranilate isomerase [Hymenobacter luteus]